MSEDPNDRLNDVVLAEQGLPPANSDIAHERAIAIFDLKERNSFAVAGKSEGPYALSLSIKDGKLHFAVAAASGEVCAEHGVSIAPLRRLMRDYFTVCESYYSAIRDATPMQIEAIDMGRRGLHNEGADLLAKALEGVFAFDFETARRLFTLVCAMQQTMQHRG